MSIAPDLPRRVVIVGDTPIAIGVAGLLLAAGVVPALVRPVAFNAFPIPDASNAGMERLKFPGWARELLVYPSLHDAVEVLGDADWILEASGLPAAEKKVLFRHVDGCRKADSLVTSDESITPVKRLTKGFSDRFCRDFAVTHFFVPVERLRLAEVVFHDSTADRSRALARRICSEMLGRKLLLCRDAPGFVANRIGIFFMAMGLREATRRGISVAAADDAAQSAIGTPRSGVFGLIDLIGVDVFVRLLDSLRTQLPDTDELQRYGVEGSTVESLIAAKRTGRQAGMGFYQYDDRGRPCAALDLGSSRYERILAGRDAEIASSYGAFVSMRVRSYMLHVCQSASVSLKEAAMAMETGYGWQPGAGFLASGD